MRNTRDVSGNRDCGAYANTAVKVGTVFFAAAPLIVPETSSNDRATTLVNFMCRRVSSTSFAGQREDEPVVGRGLTAKPAKVDHRAHCHAEHHDRDGAGQRPVERLHPDLRAAPSH